MTTIPPLPFSSREPRIRLLIGSVVVLAAAGSITIGQTLSDADLVATVPHAGDRFGQAVAISGEVAVMGAPFENGFYADMGAAYVYRNTAGGWAQETRFDAPSTAYSGANEWFGTTVATDGGVVVVGAPQINSVAVDDGAVYVYRSTFDAVTETWSWALEQKLTASDPSTSAQFGTAVTIEGDAILVGAPGAGSGGSGYVFRYGGGQWTEEAKLQTASSAGARFGASVSMAGGTALVGAPLDGGGLVHVFALANSAWSMTATLTSADNGGGDQFGSSLSFDGTNALIGAHLNDEPIDQGGTVANAGAAYVFDWDGAVWTEQAKLTAATEASSQANFGFSGTLCGDVAVVGAFQAHTTGGQFTGAAYVFSFDGAAWGYDSTIVAADAVPGDLFGYGIGGCETIIIGAPGDEPDGSSQDYFGSAYIYTLDVAPDPVDSDGDGLSDAIEIDIGTDPFNADTDGDNISDGDEVNITGTNPLSADTDGDGVNDDVDPLPLVPGVTGEWLEAESRSLADAIAAIDLAEFNGPNGKANKGRRNSLASRVRNAAKAIARDDYASAIDLLEGVLDKVDGDDSVPDWMNPGPEQEALATEITLLIGLLLYG